MKRLMIPLLATLFLPLGFARAQPFVLLDQYEVTGFVAPNVSVSRLLDQTAFSIGGAVALVVDHTTVIGVEGFGLLPGVQGPDGRHGERADLEMLYGGFLLERVGLTDAPFSYVVRMMVGGGGVRYEYSSPVEQYSALAPLDLDIEIPLGRNPDYWDAFFVFEPGVGVEYKAADNLRIELIAKCRFMYGVALVGFQTRDVNGLAAQATVKLGSF